jgi:hypothetical protein
MALSCRIASIALLTALAGCGASEDASPPVTTAEARLVGSVAGTDARIGLVIDATKGTLYVCGGDATRSKLSRCFSGPRTSAGLDWTSGDLRVVASQSGDTWSGEVRQSDGTSLRFDLAPVTKGTIAGLYDVKLPEGRAGVVVFQPSSTEPATMLGTIEIKAMGIFQQVLPVREVLVTARGIEVQATGVSTTFFVQPTSP